MLSHIPVDVFCTQINGDVETALKVLDARPSALKNRTRTFDWEFSLDPDNPVTQVSKTPSDEDFPSDFNDEDQVNVVNSPSQAFDYERGNELSMVAENDELLHVSVQEGNTKVTDVVEDEGEVREEKFVKIKRSKHSLKNSKLLVHDIVQFVEELKMKIDQDAIQVHVTPSYCACRFELPIDKTRLEGMHPLNFLVQYCKIAETRKRYYGAEYEKYLYDKNITHLLSTDLQDLQRKLYREPIYDHDINYLNCLVDLQPSTEIDKNLFTAISCLMERIIISNNREESSGGKKHPFEVADFSSLNAKLHKVNTPQETRNLLNFIRTS